jgi:hypothetical protein
VWQRDEFEEDDSEDGGLYLSVFKRSDGHAEAVSILRSPDLKFNSTCIGIVTDLINQDAVACGSPYRGVDPFFARRLVLPVASISLLYL